MPEVKFRFRFLRGGVYIFKNVHEEISAITDRGTISISA